MRKIFGITSYIIYAFLHLKHVIAHVCVEAHPVMVFVENVIKDGCKWN